MHGEKLYRAVLHINAYNVIFHNEDTYDDDYMFCFIDRSLLLQKNRKYVNFRKLCLAQSLDQLYNTYYIPFIKVGVFYVRKRSI